MGTKIARFDFVENSISISFRAFGRQVFCFIYFIWRNWIQACLSGVRSRFDANDLMQISAWNTDVCLMVRAGCQFAVNEEGRAASDIVFQVRFLCLDS